jgi:hypothetical protein
VIQDPETKLFHLYFSEMRVGGLHTYSQPGHCQLTTAASTSPLGPFNMQRTVLRSSATGPISHNVQPQVGGDGAIYIFMITSDPHPGAAPDAAGPSGPLSVIVGRAPKVGAEFQWVTPRLLDTNGTEILKDNPSAIVYANGTVLMVTRGTALFTAQSWRGPYQMLRSAIIPNEDVPSGKFYNNISTRTEGAAMYSFTEQTFARCIFVLRFLNRGCSATPPQRTTFCCWMITWHLLSAVHCLLLSYRPVFVAVTAWLPHAHARPRAVSFPQAGADIRLYSRSNGRERLAFLLRGGCQRNQYRFR